VVVVLGTALHEIDPPCATFRSRWSRESGYVQVGVFGARAVCAALSSRLDAIVVALADNAADTRRGRH